MKKYQDLFTKEVQLVINRLFSPFFPMTRLLRLINWEKIYFSIDGENNKDWVKLNQLKDWIPNEINKFFIR